MEEFRSGLVRRLFGTSSRRTVEPISAGLRPIVIGATGGSGTRPFARICQRAGIFMGSNRNAAEDALEFVQFFDRWINRYGMRRGQPLSEEERSEMEREFEESLRRHRESEADAFRGWGWKAPRSIFLLPFFHERFPAMKFLHVVRDGRDMALSSNQNQLNKHGITFVGEEESAGNPVMRSLLLWSRNNIAAADYGESRMPDSYVRVRFEDLCAEPVPTVNRILEFVGVEADGEEIARAEVIPPASIGRWRDQADLFVELPEVARQALARFGYEAPKGRE